MTRAMELQLLDSKKKMVSGTYLRNAWYVAAWSDNLADGQLLSRTILKEPIVLFRKSDGHIAALQDRCPHRFAPLHMGKIVGGDRVQCPYHGLEFDASGACVLNTHGTKRNRIPSRANYELLIDNLRDLSHTSYLHDGILGNSDTVELPRMPSCR